MSDGGGEHSGDSGDVGYSDLQDPTTGRFKKGHKGGPGRPKGSGSGRKAPPKKRISVDMDTPLEELAEIGVRALLLSSDANLKAKGVAGLRALKEVQKEPEPDAVMGELALAFVGLFSELTARTGLTAVELLRGPMLDHCLDCRLIGCAGFVSGDGER